MLRKQRYSNAPRCVKRQLYTAGRIGPVLWQRASVAEPAPGGAEGGGARGLLRGSPRDPLGRPDRAACGVRGASARVVREDDKEGAGGRIPYGPMRAVAGVRGRAPGSFQRELQRGV